MSDGATIAAIAACLSMLISLGTIAGFFMRRGKDEGVAQAELQLAKANSDKASALSAACLAELKITQERFAEYREKQAERLGNFQAMLDKNGEGIIAAENRLVKSLDSMGERFEAMSGRLDEMFAAFIKRAASP
jgi:hypothetical protein